MRLTSRFEEVEGGYKIKRKGENFIKSRLKRRVYHHCVSKFAILCPPYYIFLNEGKWERAKNINKKTGNG